MEKKTVVIGEMDNSDGTFESANRVYDKRNAAPTIPTCGGGGIQPKVVKLIGGIGEENEFGSQFRQQNRVYDNKELSVSMTSAGINGLYPRKVETMEEEKTVEDYLYHAKDGEQYGIFRLSVRECGRLMGVRDDDIDKMMVVNSNTRCYACFGNSIVTTVLMAIFSQLHIKDVLVWNEISEEERQVMVDDAKGVYTK